jgi:hypothetical protein
MSNTPSPNAPRVHVNPLPTGKTPLAQAIQAFGAPVQVAGTVNPALGSSLEAFRNRTEGH